MSWRYRFVKRYKTHPQKVISFLKYTATPSPRHPITFLALPVSPDFSKAS